MMKHLRSATAIIALVFIAIFAIQNLAAVDVSFLVWSASVSKIVVILGSYVLGMLTGWGMVDLFKKFLKSKKAEAKESTVKNSAAKTTSSEE